MNIIIVNSFAQEQNSMLVHSSRVTSIIESFKALLKCDYIEVLTTSEEPIEAHRLLSNGNWSKETY